MTDDLGQRQWVKHITERARRQMREKGLDIDDDTESLIQSLLIPNSIAQG